MASDRRKRLPKMKVTTDNGISKRSVSNIFNCNQNHPNNDKMAKKLRWKPTALKLNVLPETLMPIFDQRKNKTKIGAAHSAVKTSDTNRDGRFSGSRN